MKGLLWLLLAAMLLAAGRTDDDSREGEECPVSCSCTTMGPARFIATCSNIDPTQTFGSSTGMLVIEDVPAPGLVLDNKIFDTVGLEDIRSISIMSSRFQKLDSRAFSNLDSLTNLKLEANNHMVLHPDMFNTTGLIQLSIRHSKLKFSQNDEYLFKIPQLREIEMINCDLPELSEKSFSEMPLLQSINLASNRIKHDTMFSSLKDLEEVDLSDNLISEINPENFANSSLEILKLHKNPLSTIKGVTIDTLTELDLSLCKFNKIDADTFSGFPQLTHLNLSGNAISEIDVNAFSTLENLVNLDLSNNALKGPLMPDLFLENRQLGVLSLAHNPSLRVLPARLLRGLAELFKLDISYCGLTKLEDNLFAGLTDLITLKLSGNTLEEVNLNSLDMGITSLDLSYNNIGSLDNIQFTPGTKIKTLYLTGNMLREISTKQLKNLWYLAKLDVSSCGLTNLWVTNKNERSTVLRSVTTLILSKNNIKTILTRQLHLTPHLDYIDISENPLVCDANFHESLKWFKEHGVEPMHSYGDEEAKNSDSPKQDLLQAESMHQGDNMMIGDHEVLPGHPYGNDMLSTHIEDNYNAERIILHQWNSTEHHVCGYRMREEIEPKLPELPDNNLDADNADDILNKQRDYDLSDLEGLVTRQSVREEELNSWWPIMVTIISGFAILLALSILACFVLRWYRQRNSYGAAMIKHHLNTPKLKRDRSSIYQQLYEDPNSPTTPVMSMKLPNNQTHYKFPENEEKPGYITCTNEDGHASKIIPQPV